MGVGAVASMLVADEVEHYRCGIGCVLESNHSTGGVYMAKTIRGGTALGSGVEEGDEVLRVDGFHVVRGSTSVDEVSSHIRGKEGSIVTMVVRKPSGEVRTIRLVRARLPGHKTELLGALWQSPGKKVSREMTIGDKLDVLGQLHRRGNLTDTEYHSARRRLIEGSQHYEPREPEYKQHVAKNINSLSDVGNDQGPPHDGKEKPYEFRSSRGSSVSSQDKYGLSVSSTPVHAFVPEFSRSNLASPVSNPSSMQYSPDYHWIDGSPKGVPS